MESVRAHWVDRRVMDRHGDVLGVVVDVYEDATGRPAWLAVATGYFGARVAIVPLTVASDRGLDVLLTVDRSTISRAPSARTAVTVDAADAAALVDHYAEGAAGVPPPLPAPPAPLDRRSRGPSRDPDEQRAPRPPSGGRRPGARRLIPTNTPRRTQP